MNKSVLICVAVAVFCATFAVAKPGKQMVSLKSLGAEMESRYCLDFLCANNCKLNLWQGGVCINGNCYCYKYTYTNTVAEDKQQEKQVVSLKSLGGEQEAKACDTASCTVSCQQQGWLGGVCISGSCYCWKV